MTPMIGGGMTFKPGDRVRVNKPSSHHHGQTGTVRDSWSGVTDIWLDTGGLWLVGDKFLTLADSTEGGEKA
jgi:hypothetical protein